jgi:ABC-type lipoprotein export system ATPase subunit
VVTSGLNGTVLAYGQTGTGKTYTMGMLGPLDEASSGIVPRAISEMFNKMREMQLVQQQI